MSKDDKRSRPKLTKFHLWFFISVFAILVIAGVTSYAIVNKAFYSSIFSLFISKDLSKSAIDLRDVQYCESINPAQQVDIFVPKAKIKPLVPIVIYIHGGGWQSGSRSNPIEDIYAPLFVSRGIAFASVDYRLSNEELYPAQNEDVHCAVSYIFSQAYKYDIDPNSIGIMGDSAGGHLASMEVLSTDSRDNVKAALILYGVSDLWDQITNHNDTNAISYLGVKDKTLAYSASPINANLKNAPPFLFIHGTADTVVPSEQSTNLLDKLLKVGNKAAYIPVNGAGHAYVEGDKKYEITTRDDIVNFFARYLYK